MEKKKGKKKVEGRLGREKWRRREGRRRKNGAGKGRKREKKSRATKSSFICTVSNNFQCIYSVPQGIGHCLIRQ